MYQWQKLMNRAGKLQRIKNVSDSLRIFTKIKRLSRYSAAYIGSKKAKKLMPLTTCTASNHKPRWYKITLLWTWLVLTRTEKSQQPVKELLSVITRTKTRLLRIRFYSDKAVLWLEFPLQRVKIPRQVTLYRTTTVDLKYRNVKIGLLLQPLCYTNKG